MRRFGTLALLTLVLGGCSSVQIKMFDQAAQQINSSVFKSSVVGAEIALQVAKDSPTPVPEDHEDRVVVVYGDTLWSIASREYSLLSIAPYGEGGYLWEMLCLKNRILDCNMIYPGQIIIVPDLVDAKDNETLTRILGQCIRDAFKNP